MLDEIKMTIDGFVQTQAKFAWNKHQQDLSEPEFYSDSACGLAN